MCGSAYTQAGELGQFIGYGLGLFYCYCFLFSVGCFEFDYVVC